MNRHRLAHVLRAASGIVDDPDILVIGSQSLLASHDEDQLPYAATASMEVDLAYFDDPDDSKADMIDGAIGELSLFHESFGFYEAHLIDAATLRARIDDLPDDLDPRVPTRPHSWLDAQQAAMS